MAQFVIDQAGLPAGTLDRARTDGLDDGSIVTLDATQGGGTNFKFELLWVPVGDNSAVNTLAVTANPAIWTFVPTPGVYGTYRIRLTVDEGEQTESTIIRTFSVRTPNLNLVIPAFNTIADKDASLLLKGPAQISESEDNATDYPGILGGFNYCGWWRALYEIINAVENGGGGGGGIPGGPNNAVQFNAGGGNFGGSANFTWDEVARDLLLNHGGSGNLTVNDFENVTFNGSVSGPGSFFTVNIANVLTFNNSDQGQAEWNGFSDFIFNGVGLANEGQFFITDVSHVVFDLEGPASKFARFTNVDEFFIDVASTTSFKVNAVTSASLLPNRVLSWDGAQNVYIDLPAGGGGSLQDAYDVGRTIDMLNTGNNPVMMQGWSFSDQILNISRGAAPTITNAAVRIDTTAAQGATALEIVHDFLGMAVDIQGGDFNWFGNGANFILNTGVGPFSIDLTGDDLSFNQGGSGNVFNLNFTTAGTVAAGRVLSWDGAQNVYIDLPAGGGGSLQDAYNLGPSILVDSLGLGPVAINTNAAGPPALTLDTFAGTGGPTLALSSGGNNVLNVGAGAGFDLNLTPAGITGTNFVALLSGGGEVLFDGAGAGQFRVENFPNFSVDAAGNVSMAGKLTVAGLIDPTGLVLTEQAAAPATPLSSEGLIWIRQADKRLMFLDGDGNSFQLNASQLFSVIEHSFSTNVTMSDPGAGNWRLNNATQNLSNQLVVHKIDDNGTDRGAIQAATFKSGALLYIQSEDNSSEFITVELTADGTDNGIWWLLDFTVTDSGNSIPNNQVSAGVVGGAGGGAGGGASQGPANTVNAADGAGGWAATDLDVSGDTISAKANLNLVLEALGAGGSMSLSANQSITLQTAVDDINITAADTLSLEGSDINIVRGVDAYSWPTTQTNGYLQNVGGVMQWTAAAPGSAYQTIEDNGTPVTARGTINFLNADSIVDNAGNDSTDITLPSGGGGGGSGGYDYVITNKQDLLDNSASAVNNGAITLNPGSYLIAGDIDLKDTGTSPNVGDQNHIQCVAGNRLVGGGGVLEWSILANSGNADGIVQSAASGEFSVENLSFVNTNAGRAITINGSTDFFLSRIGTNGITYNTGTDFIYDQSTGRGTYELFSVDGARSMVSIRSNFEFRTFRDITFQGSQFGIEVASSVTNGGRLKINDCFTPATITQWCIDCNGDVTQLEINDCSFDGGSGGIRVSSQSSLDFCTIRGCYIEGGTGVEMQPGAIESVQISNNTIETSGTGINRGNNVKILKASDNMFISGSPNNSFSGVTIDNPSGTPPNGSQQSQPFNFLRANLWRDLNGNNAQILSESNLAFNLSPPN